MPETLQSYNIEFHNSAEVADYIASRIKLLRQIRGFSLEEVAKNLHLTRKQIQNYETAQSTITINRLWEIASILHADFSFFIDGINGNQPEFSNQDLEILRLYNHIKDKKIKKSIIDLLKSF